MFDNDVFLSRFFEISDKTIDIFEWKELKWDFQKNKWWSRRYEYRWIQDVCNDFFSNIEGKTSLDVGVGNKHPGVFLMKDIGFEHCTGIDIFDCKKYKYKKYMNKNMIYRKKNIIKEEVGQYDCVACISVLEHMESYLQKVMLENIVKSVKKDGIILLTFDYPCFDYMTDLAMYKNIFRENNIEFKEGDNRAEKITSFNNEYANKIDKDKKITCYRLLGRRA